MNWISKKELKQIVKNRNINNEFEVFTYNFNTFLLIINGNQLSNERLIYNDEVNGIFQRKVKKENGREFQIDTNRFCHNQFKKVLDRLL
jgi:hypothetical protein